MVIFICFVNYTLFNLKSPVAEVWIKVGKIGCIGIGKHYHSLAHFSAVVQKLWNGGDFLSQKVFCGGRNNDNVHFLVYFGYNLVFNGFNLIIVVFKEGFIFWGKVGRGVTRKQSNGCVNIA